MDSVNLWSRRYRSEGEIWGEGLSPALDVLLPLLKPKSHAIEIGFGYGRDLMALLSAGHRAIGFEMTTEGLNLNPSLWHHRNLQLTIGRFDTCSLPSNHFDAVWSHRTLHLMPENQIPGIVKKCADVLKESGLICFSARDDRDFKPDQMRWVGEGIAEYTIPDRQGHRISFWNKSRFISAFEGEFDVLDTIQSEEPESNLNHGKQAYFTIMVGRKK